MNFYKELSNLWDFNINDKEVHIVKIINKKVNT